MTTIEQILNWLTIGLEQPIGSLNENFYYDKRDDEFFSIMALDYFMLDINMNISKEVTTSYTKAQENSLVDRIKRIENHDPTIISIPRIPLQDRQIFMRQFVTSLTNQELIDILNQRIQNQDYRTKFDFHFENEADEIIIQKWKDAKRIFLLQQVDTFLNLNNININNSTIWVIDSESSITIDLTKDEKPDSSPVLIKSIIKKPWWKFW